MPNKFTPLKKAKRLKKSSQKWLLRQINDPFVKKAKDAGYRSRAAFKLVEIDQKFKILKKGKIVVDLGAAPGGWSQVSVAKVGAGNVLAIDLLEMPAIAGVRFLQQDFLSENSPQEIINILQKELGKKRCDVVLSDMAANTIGDAETDHMRIIALLEEALHLAEKILQDGGCFVGKIFQGGSSDEILKKLRQNFASAKYFKPNSSRKDSAENYLVAIGFTKGRDDRAQRIFKSDNV
jgi:23S rRNA (uridine2552-2'-O)-methyltransferase